ncbi:HK97 gp10 family phage protein [Xylophilus rhododendri]|uniref:HK97 gp10 family phage protein n=1 Tax=Xylophilus rhododendri TaxID=2697032 RepID=A0A857J820_9BURK|nr:HK97 gp10 family phage protein [Xylophilus rhododendri]QHJ00115.1 HK97 gp10 family phage protein [Xylophilus rhododendri]
MTFAAQIALFASKTKLGMDTVVRKVAFDLGSALVIKSPVDSGRFKNNWQIGVGSVNLAIDSANDPSGAAALTRLAASIATVKAGGVLYLTNSLPYAQRLEYGWSKQAPAGMVRTTTAEYGTYLRKAIAS